MLMLTLLIISVPQISKQSGENKTLDFLKNNKNMSYDLIANSLQCNLQWKQ